MFVMANLKEFDGLRAISTDLIFDDHYQKSLNLDSISPSQLYRRLSSLETSVLHRGYIEYENFDKITDAGGHFVIRIKSNSVTWTNTRYDNPKGVLYTSKGPVGSGKKKTKHEYYYIQKADDDGTIYHLLTNIPDLETDTGLGFEDVCDIYKHRWKIELFFKWIKQHSEVKHFFATNEVGAMNQIYITLILYCLLAIFKQNLSTKATLNKIRIAIRASLYNTFEDFKRKIMKLNPF